MRPLGLMLITCSITVVAMEYLQEFRSISDDCLPAALACSNGKTGHSHNYDFHGNQSNDNQLHPVARLLRRR